LDFGFLNESSAGAKIKSALRAIKNVLLKGVARVGRQFIEEIPFSGHLFNCFAMFHT
jgi:hypothetical protein